MLSGRPRFRLAIYCSLLACAGFAAAQDNGNKGQDLNRQFQSAVAEYNAGQFPEAAAHLESLLPRVPKSFEVHELLGQVYAAQSQDAKAVDQLKTAVHLKPDSAAARTNLAAILLHAGKPALAGEQFRKALELEPQSYDANHNLGEFYIQTGKIADACSFLAQAQRINPSSYGNGYDLALAYFLTGHDDQARELIQSLVGGNNTGELHNLLGQIDEKDSQFVAAANEFQTAAHLDPSEDNLFAWGSELLLHQAYEPATEVFQRAVGRYPSSSRMKIGLGIATYSEGKYEEAVGALLAAVDLNSSDPRCYYFLSRAYDMSPHQAADVIQRFQRYAERQPANPLAQYYYAMSLWKGKQADGGSPNLKLVEALLQKSLELNHALPETHLQLGNLYADEHEYDKSIPEYERALELNPNLADAHYRLAQDYVRVGQKDRAQAEFAVFQKARAQHMAEIDKENAEVRQFVYSAEDGATTKQ
jgi:predicted Zn-dependent protease